MKTPSYFVYYNRRQHVTISVQYSSQVLSTVSKSYTQTSSVLNKSQVQNSSTNCLPLLRNPSWFNERSKFESPWLQRTIFMGNLLQCLCKSHAQLLSQLIANSPFHLPLPLVSTELSMHCSELMCS